MLIFIIWLGTSIFSYNQKWLKPNEFGDMFGGVNSLFTALSLIGITYTIYLQHTALEREKADRQKAEERRKKQLEPHLGYGVKAHNAQDNRHQIEITISDPENKLRSPSISLFDGVADGLNIGDKGQKCSDHQYRIAAVVEVESDKKVIIKFDYKDQDENQYSKLISYPPLEITDNI